MSKSGTVKWFDADAGYGFINTAEGDSIFVHIRDCGQCPPQKDDTLYFDTQPSGKGGTLNAVNVTGGTGAAWIDGKYVGLAVGEGKIGSGSMKGTCKNFGKTGWGFILGPDGTEYFCHISDCKDGMRPQAGDVLAFDLKPNDKGGMVAINVSGGTVPIDTGKGKGKGKDGSLCFMYIVGKCKFDRGCNMRHPPTEECKTILASMKRTDCKFGNNCSRNDCVFKHPDGREERIHRDL
eukprot:gnl/TRDRNA2_/TRDRNA2_125968_c1_seq2.p1 gnl/TRDRNA2_/TRDRNA2_125968_c1~~gnl/TRDRNA2_/TRDRNA2_125968_c1_seq2.p1  ORF type:complete len:236 (+),score=42.05 gnl/TRDRNA2_/TRDRNA2_125968_c1_seq2:168-875(+)